MGKDEFIKLLVAQMTHQDPLAPMDGQQMAAQLAQFSSVEQLINISGKFDAQSAASNALLGVVNNSSAIDLIGKTVTILDDQVLAGQGGTESVDIDVPEGGRGRMQILDANGAVIREIELGALPVGQRTLAMDEALRGLPSGPYRVAVDVTHADGSTTELQTRLTVNVDGVRMSAAGAYITSGSMSYPIGLVDSVRATLPTS
jgi:flagellar basal-body rod modification protein FlgD